MPTSYSWDLTSPAFSGSLPNPGPYVASIPTGLDARKKQFERGIKFANVPGGRADFVVHGGPRVYHVNSVMTMLQTTSDRIERTGVYSGVVKFRFRNHRRFPVPASVNKVEYRSCNEYTEPVFPFTGR